MSGTAVSLVFAMGRILLGLLLLGAAAAKIFSGQRYLISSIKSFEIVRNERLISLASLLLPTAEVVLGVLLLAGLVIKISLLAAVILLVSFSAAVAFAFFAEKGASCACFGKLSSMQPIRRSLLVRNGTLTLVAVALLAAPEHLSRLMVPQLGAEQQAIVTTILLAGLVGSCLGLYRALGWTWDTGVRLRVPQPLAETPQRP